VTDIASALIVADDIFDLAFELFDALDGLDIRGFGGKCFRDLALPVDTAENNALEIIAAYLQTLFRAILTKGWPSIRDLKIRFPDKGVEGDRFEIAGRCLGDTFYSAGFGTFCLSRSQA